MDPTTMNNIGTGGHFWFTSVSLVITFFACILPIGIMAWYSLSPIFKNDWTPDMGEYRKPKKAHVIWSITGFLFCVALWSAWGPGKELDIYQAEDDGGRKMTLEEFPDEQPKEVLKEEAQEWKSETQKDFEEKVKNQEDPQDVLEKALERAKKREGENK